MTIFAGTLERGAQLGGVAYASSFCAVYNLSTGLDSFHSSFGPQILQSTNHKIHVVFDLARLFDVVFTNSRNNSSLRGCQEKSAAVLLRMDSVDLAERASLVRTDKSERQVGFGVDKIVGSTFQYFRCGCSFDGDFVCREELLAHAHVLQKSIVCFVLRSGLRSDIGLFIVPSLVRTLGHYYR